MDEIFDLTSLIKKQKMLDKDILEHHPSISYYELLTKLKLALIVELGEFANTTRCFKFWSNKTMMEKSVVLDEYADIVHFLLSLTYRMGIDSLSLEISKQTQHSDLTEMILRCSKLFNDLDVTALNEISLVRCWQQLLMIAFKLNFRKDDIVNSYNKKHEINYKRQRENY